MAQIESSTFISNSLHRVVGGVAASDIWYDSKNGVLWSSQILSVPEMVNLSTGSVVPRFTRNTRS